MKIEKNLIVPYDNERMELIGPYDDKGKLNGEGRILDRDGVLLCEGRFEHGIQKHGFLYIDGQTYSVESFDGVNGYGTVIETGNILANFINVKCGVFKDGELNGIGVCLDQTEDSIAKGLFEMGKFKTGSKVTYRGKKHEIQEEYTSYDGKKRIGTVRYPGDGEVIEGEITLGFQIYINGTLSSTETGDKWVGCAKSSGGGWQLISGHGKWKGYEGTFENGVPWDGKGILPDYDAIIHGDYFKGTWEKGSFSGEKITDCE